MSNILDDLLQQAGSNVQLSDNADSYSSTLNTGDRFTAIDGDTIEDSVTGYKFRTEGYDTVETLDGGNSKLGKSGIELSHDKTATNYLQNKLDTNEITGQNIATNIDGVDVFGRPLYKNRKLAEEMVGGGMATNTDKYDPKMNELYRKAQEKEYKLTGHTNEELETLRHYDLDRQSATHGFVDRSGNLVDAFQSRGMRTIASLGDTILDGLKFWGDGNSDLLDKYTDADYMDKSFGYDNRDSKYALAEANYKLRVGKYAEAFVEAGSVAPELVTESAPEMLEMMIGPAGELKAGANIFNKLVHLGKANSGLMTWSAHHTNELIDKRMENNGGKDVGLAEVGMIYTQSLILGALDKVAFKDSFLGNNNFKTIKEYLSVANTGTKANALHRASVGILSSVGQTTKAMVEEGGQEYIQEMGDALSETYGTEKTMSLEDLHYRSLTAAVAGAVSGGAINHVGQGFQGFKSSYVAASEMLGKHLYKSELQTSSDEEVVNAMNNLSSDLETISSTKSELETIKTNLKETKDNHMTKTDTGVSIKFSEIQDPEVHAVYDKSVTTHMAMDLESRPEEAIAKSDAVKNDDTNTINKLVDHSMDTLITNTTDSSNVKEMATSLNFLDVRFNDNEVYTKEFKPKVLKLDELKQNLLQTDPKDQQPIMQQITDLQTEVTKSYQDVKASEKDVDISAQTLVKLDISTQLLNTGEVSMPLDVHEKVIQDVDNFHKVIEEGLNKTEQQLKVKQSIAEVELNTRDIPDTYDGLTTKIDTLKDGLVETTDDTAEATVSTYEHQKVVVDKYAKEYNITPEEAFTEITTDTSKNRLNENSTIEETNLHKETLDVKDFNTAVNQGLVDMKFKKRIDSKFKDDIINQYKLTGVTDYQSAFKKLQDSGIIC